ncbi:hypothetical protein BT96DRAFT_978884 [Gymnopus androsaceus JB14]|uniref:N-acetyltransferase domain-containing protein n=1 Tax=Gymnopus androsaceus JB14 TaxID=1447944 RepID=A0A6A4H5R9_9AGAR|nr:hypothetical protein BT96DRAFT_978884 [Gymnopus androsaceus JB14]
MLSLVKDDNFCFPIPDVLETEKLKLPSLHADNITNAADTNTWRYLPIGPFTSAQDFIERYYEARVRPNSGYTVFVGLDKTRLSSNGDPIIAGMTGYIHTSRDELRTELMVLVLPKFQHTHVASHMIGLLLRYALNLPTDPERGLGLRRVQWETNAKNKSSIGLAMKMGLRMEGLKRWAGVLQPGKEDGSNGHSTRQGDPREGQRGSDTACLAICWDEWEEGGKKRVEEILMR